MTKLQSLDLNLANNLIQESGASKIGEAIENVQSLKKLYLNVGYNNLLGVEIDKLSRSLSSQ